MDTSATGLPRREAWNKGKLVRQKSPLKLKDIWRMTGTGRHKPVTAGDVCHETGRSPVPAALFGARLDERNLRAGAEVDRRSPRPGARAHINPHPSLPRETGDVRSMHQAHSQAPGK